MHHCTMTDRAAPASGSPGGPAPWLWAAGQAMTATVGSGQQVTHALGRARIWPSGRGSNRNPFPFHFDLNSSLNFENSYLFEYLSKICETSSVGFLILRSIHEKY
jgi:hypothetical protein